MRRAVATLAALTSLACATSASAATTWHVDASKNGSACTQADPCKTINAAVAKASDGDTIQIAAGSYTESIDTGKRLTFDGAGPKILVDPATLVQATTTGAAIRLTNGGTIKDMAVVGSSSGAVPLASTALDLATPAPDGPATTYTISNVGAYAGLSAKGDPGDALYTDPLTPQIIVHVSDSLLQGQAGSSPGDAVDLIGERAGKAEDGVFTFHNVHVDAQDEATGIQVAGGTLTADGGLLEGGALYTLLTDYSGSSVLRGTRVTSNGTASYTGTSDASLTARDSLLMGKEQAAYVTGGAHATFVGSTVVAHSTHPTAALSMDSSSSPGVAVTAVNSIFRAIADGPPAAPDISALAESGGSATFTPSNSSYTTVSNSGASVPAAGSGTNASGDPGFTDVVHDDFTLGPASPLIDRGTTAAVTAGEHDLAGHARKLDGNGDCLAVPDIGAFERPAVAPKKSCGPPPDKVAPVISGVHFKPHKLHPGHAGKLSLALSEKATLGIVIQRRKGGKWRSFAQLLKGGVGPGPMTLKIGPKVAGHKLRRGRYRITLLAADAAGNRSKPRTVKFRVVKP